MFLALGMIGKGGSHIDYCPNLPARYLLECMPSLKGISLAAVMATLLALVVMAIDSMLMGIVAVAKGLARRN